MLCRDVSLTHITSAPVAHTADGTHTLSYRWRGAAGNAVIAIYNTPNPTDAGAEFLWTFHVWVSDRTAASDQAWSVLNLTDGDTNIPNRYTLMERNLGATTSELPSASNSYSNASYGLMYQWGRKDPFVGSATYNTNTFKTMHSSFGFTSKTNVARNATTGTMLYASIHPTSFITINGDWKVVRDDNLWGNPSTSRTDQTKMGVKTIYDPCPAGYRVSAQDALTRVLKSAIV